MAQLLNVSMDCDDVISIDPGEVYGLVSGEDNTTVRISNVAAEDGLPQPSGPLSWLNSVRVTADIEEDAVHCVVSVGDPRGGFCFTVRRLPDGKLIIHTPYPGESAPHVEVTSVRPGTLEVAGNYADEHCGCVDDVQEDE